MTHTGTDARRRGRGPLHVGGRITGRTYHRCECGAEWATAYKARKCVRTHAEGEAGEASDAGVIGAGRAGSVESGAAV